MADDELSTVYTNSTSLFVEEVKNTNSRRLCMFDKLLIANRGEIAVRIIRACREMGIQTVAVYSEADKDALHTKLADEAICIGPAQSNESYLNMENIISAAIGTGAKAIHPGFGFLSENSRFAEKCEICNIAFIGPPSGVMRKMGNKVEARAILMDMGFPIIQGSKTQISDKNRAKLFAEEMGYPIMIKAVAGGGGKGMRIVKSKEEFIDNFNSAQLEAKKAFDNDAMYLERYIEEPRHIEFQILADKYGNVVHLGERDCSIQRYHQKIIEEAPSSILSYELRNDMGNAAIEIARAVQYEGVGTIEFLLDRHSHYYFIEMNTRVQVEHAVTEMISNIDIIKEQIKIAAGYPLQVKQNEIQIRGHSIECRINAEDPRLGFRPCSGQIKNLHLPGGNGVRIDTAIFSGYFVPPYYDSMLAKIIVHDSDRISAINKMKGMLNELKIDGIPTNLKFQQKVLDSSSFRKGDYTTNFIEKYFSEI